MPMLDPRLLSLLGHELRAPVGVIGGYLAMLERGDAGLSPTERQVVDGARRAQQVAVAILDDVSRLAAAARDAAPASVANVPLSALVAAVEAAAQARGVTVSVDVPATGVHARGDAAITPGALGTVAAAIAREHDAPMVCAVHAGDDTLTVRLGAGDRDTTDAAPQPFDDLRPGMGLRLVVAVGHLRHIGGDVHDLVREGRSCGAVIVLPRANGLSAGRT